MLFALNSLLPNGNIATLLFLDENFSIDKFDLGLIF